MNYGKKLKEIRKNNNLNQEDEYEDNFKIVS